MNLKLISSKSPLSSSHKTTHKKADPTFKVIDSSRKPTDRSFQNLSHFQDLSILKDLNMRMNIKNDSGSTTTHSSSHKVTNGLPNRKSNKLSQSPLNYCEFKHVKEGTSTSGRSLLGADNINTKKKSLSFKYFANSNQKKFDEICREEWSNLLKTQDATIEKLKKHIDEYKTAENTLTEKIIKLEKENLKLKNIINKMKSEKKLEKDYDLKQHNNNELLHMEKKLMKLVNSDKSYFENRDKLCVSENSSREKSLSISDVAKTVKRNDIAVQVFFPDEWELEKELKNEDLLSCLGLLEKKINEIESQARILSKPSEGNIYGEKSDEKNKILELEDSFKEIFIKNKVNEGLLIGVKNERDYLKEVLKENKCLKCEERLEGERKRLIPTPSFIKLINYGNGIG